MDPTLYNAAVEGIILDGDISLTEEYLKRDEEIGYQVTPKGNTILHVAANEGHSHFVGEVLKVTPKLLCCKNKKNETALHLAANKGHTEVARVLLRAAGEGNKETLIRMTDDDGDTALHKAVRTGCVDTVTLLVKEDPEFEFPANKAGETPLYLAAESGSLNCLLKILVSCDTPTYGGPCGRTALHAAIIHKNMWCATSLWQLNKSLCEEPDKWGWNSLHYAVKVGLIEVVSDMLRWKKSLAYLPAGSGNDWTKTIHIAASEGDINMINELLKHCPDCWEMLNSRGQNFLHVAILSHQRSLIRSFLVGKLKGWHIILADEKDNDGNTPLHLLAASHRSLAPAKLGEHPSAKKMSFNKENKTPLDVALSWTSIQNVIHYESFRLRLRNGRPGLRDFEINYTNMGKQQWYNPSNKIFEEIFQELVNVTQVGLVVATLLVTVTFAAGFTLPGGFDSDPGPNKGMAILTRKIAFRAFIVSDAIAFACSAGAVYCYSFISTYAVTRELKNLRRLHMIANKLQLVAIPAVVIAFVTGMYSTLAHSHGLAVTVCAIGCIYFLLHVLIYLTTEWIGNNE